MDQFDVVVIGGGPGGYVAAIRASQLKLKTALVEREHLGGICLNWGCIPTKALLRTAEIFHNIQRADEFGIKVKGAEIDIEKVVKRSRNVAGTLSGGIGHLLKKNKVTVFSGSAKLAGKGKISIDDKGKKTEIAGKNIIIATGARARTIPGFEADGKLIWTYKEAMTPDIMPKSLLVVGSGAIGIEFASFYHNLGAEVTVVEVADRILAAEDAEISATAQKIFEKQGIKINTGSNLKKFEKGKNNVKVTFESKGKTQQITVDRVIMAVGIVGNSENLGLENTKVKVDRNHIVTNQWMATDELGVYAIGDVTGAPWLAHKASHEGIICIEKIAGLHTKPMDKTKIPGCTYCLPQVASVGLTEQKAKDLGHEIKIGRFPFIGNGKAVALGEEKDGLIKVIFDSKTGALLGAHMIGAEVTELIQGYCIAMNLETTEQELMHTIFAHPTLSEAMHEAVLAAYGHPIHI